MAWSAEVCGPLTETARVGGTPPPLFPVQVIIACAEKGKRAHVTGREGAHWRPGRDVDGDADASSSFPHVGALQRSGELTGVTKATDAIGILYYESPFAVAEGSDGVVAARSLSMLGIWAIAIGGC